jgi:hypothetical protein
MPQVWAPDSTYRGGTRRRPGAQNSIVAIISAELVLRYFSHGPQFQAAPKCLHQLGRLLAASTFRDTPSCLGLSRLLATREILSLNAQVGLLLHSQRACTHAKPTQFIGLIVPFSRCAELIFSGLAEYFTLAAGY